ncbi:uncharacterized protein LOC143487767 [Brachyhypopomus gauderio]|uniref:uncharacterized protein LOC143487767 n=1 Tax=Brachyhypopomus gauderio TaxID=698409 RepID=UPI0040418129
MWRAMDIHFTGEELFHLPPSSCCIRKLGEYTVTDLNQRFHENFSEMVPSLLKLLRGKSTIDEKAYADSRGEALVEDTTGMDLSCTDTPTYTGLRHWEAPVSPDREQHHHTEHWGPPGQCSESSV